MKAGTSIKVATDLVSNPTWTSFFSKIILKSIYLDLSGLYHYGSDKNISCFDFACRIAQKFNCDKDLIIPVSSEEIMFTANRPKNTGLTSDKLSKLIDVDIDSIDYALKLIGSNL